MATITIEQAKLIAGEERPTARLKLACCLGWQDLNEENERQKGIYLDCLYDSLAFCIQKGLPWQHSCELFSLTDTMLNHCRDKTIIEAVQIYKDMCRNLADIGSHSLMLFTDYFFSSFFQHYNLYAYVFRNAQEQLITKLNPQVESPDIPTPFSSATDITKWTYEQKIKSIEEEETKIEVMKKEKQKVLEQEDKSSMETVQKELSELQVPLEREELIGIIQKVAASHLISASHSILHNLENTVDSLDFMLQKTQVPRPQALGPPPRYKTHAPLGGQTNQKQPKSSKRDKSSKSQMSVKK